MKPAPFVHHAPRSVDEAVAVLAEVGHDAKVLAGGQSLIPILNMRLASPGHLVDINHVEGLGGIEIGADTVRVGALVRHRGLERSDAAYAALPLLRHAVVNLAHPAIRNRGTTVGSLVHADAAGEMPAVLALCDGVVEVVGSNGIREIGWRDFFLGALETVLAPDELAVAATFNRLPPGTGTAFAEAARRSGDYALAGVAVAVTVNDGVVSAAAASFVSVTDGPSVLDLTPALGGHEPESRAFDDALDRAAGAVAEHVAPETDIHATADYRRMLVAELTRRALPLALRRSNAAFVRESAAAALSSSTNTAFTGLGGARGAGGGSPMSGVRHDVTLTVNGVRRAASVPARRLLSDFLRHDLTLTGTHVGCEHGVCGACTVLVGGEPMRSCLMFAVSAQGLEVTTVEGLGLRPDARECPTGQSMNPVQQGFADCHGLQCGFCTPGLLLTVTAYLDEHPDPTADEARTAISGNLCRCTGYQNIVRSVLRAAEISAERQRPDAAEPGKRQPAPVAAQEHSS